MPQQALSTMTANSVQPFQNKINNMFWVKTIPATEQTEMDNILKSSGWIDTIDELTKVQNMYKDWVSKYWRTNPIVSKYEASISDALSKTTGRVKDTITTTWANIANIKDLNQNDFFAAMGWTISEWKKLKDATNPDIYTNWSSTWSSTSDSSIVSKSATSAPNSNINVSIHNHWATPTTDTSPVNISLKSNWDIISTVSDIKTAFDSKDYKWKYTKNEFEELLKSIWMKNYDQRNAILIALTDSFFKP
jgi:hypothetical protein